MKNDNIIEIGINNNEGLYIKPASATFPFMYREAIEVHWDEKENCIYGPKPRKWSYLDWYNQIVSGAKIQECNLLITNETKWVNIPEELKQEISNEFNSKNT
jgi:hypothetical protein